MWIFSVYIASFKIEISKVCRVLEILNVHSGLHQDNAFVCKGSAAVANDTEEEIEEGKCKHWADLVCGIPDKAEELVDAESENAMKDQFLRETRVWKRVLNVNAAFALMVLAFLIGFFR